MVFCLVFFKYNSRKTTLKGGDVLDPRYSSSSLILIVRVVIFIILGPLSYCFISVSYDCS